MRLNQPSIHWCLAVACLTGTLLVASGSSPVSAATCEFPLVVQAGAVDANVIFEFDSSGSMNEAMVSDDYDPNVTYSGKFDPDQEYDISAAGNYSPRSFNRRWATTPTAYLVNSDGGQDGVYIGNYLNWVFYNATAAQRGAIPRFTRVQMAKAAVSAVIGNINTNIRYGVYDFNGDKGGKQVAALGTDPNTVITKVGGIVGDSWTPLAETLVTIMNYLKTSGVGAPIQYACQKNFVVIVTDGLPTMDLGVPSYIGDPDGDGAEPGTCTSIGAPQYPSSYDCSSYLDDVALYLRTNDLRADLPGLQYANTYTIGMNIDAPLLARSADAQHGDGAYYSANNAAQVADALSKVLREIVSRISAGSAVAVVSTETQAQDLLYRGKFLPATWAGYLEAFALPYESGEAPVWEAGEILSARNPDTRNIFTSVSGTSRDFTTGQASNLRAAMGVASDAIASDVISWTRGNAVAGYRTRVSNWLLGDIVDSAPVPVGEPSSYYLNDGYLAFRDAQADRPRVIYVGANDGMVHAFAADDGEELWAYIPSNQLSRLPSIASTGYCHEFSVNGTPRAVDVYVNGSWKTVLVGGERQGGLAYYAIDVTDGSNPKFMWENSISEVSASYAQVEVARLKSSGKYVGFVGSGLCSTGETYCVGFDMETGAKLWAIALGDNDQNNMATAGTAVDLDFDGYEDVMYMGDLDGNLWSIDLTTTTPTKTLLFNTGGQSIQAQPVVTVDTDNSCLVYFGTGKYVDSSDPSNTDPQAFYCVIDNHDGSTVTTGQMVDQTSSVKSVLGKKGYYINLTNTSGERVTEPSALVNGVVYFTSFAPNTTSCGAGGSSWLYAAKFRSGAAYDSDSNDGNDTANGRSTSMGDGITARPVIDIVNGKVLIQGSDTRIHVSDTFGTIRQLVVRSWRQQ